ncbi:TetR/AcrR family transcriptional regulator [Amycolatopsis methanolica]|uniref:TetR family transcriptional regulator n=1 Tax=Amycolatopsis methanolica 239 TaxID=1068978 RepID=A0A076MUP0_AMYME|nr:TetR/AcrR family transcriptional regulator [Amycolatopsis methanolica]AIJ24479.1 TetR family transcriptional regulator [Amycolatopsis methanolica 239]
MRVIKEVRPDLGLSPAEEARRSQIIAATLATISELGYRRTSFARIKERAGLSSTRLIGYHFGTKAGLMQAVVTTAMSIRDRYLEERAGDTTDRAAMLRALIETEVMFARDHPECVRVLREVAANADDPDGWPVAGPLLSGFRTGRIERMLTQGQREGAFGEFSAEVAARTIAQSIDGAIQAYAENPALDLESYGRQLADFFEQAVAAKN